MPIFLCSWVLFLVKKKCEIKNKTHRFLAAPWKTHPLYLKIQSICILSEFKFDFCPTGQKVPQAEGQSAQSQGSTRKHLSHKCPHLPVTIFPLRKFKDLLYISKNSERPFSQSEPRTLDTKRLLLPPGLWSFSCSLLSYSSSLEEMEFQMAKTLINAPKALESINTFVFQTT